MSPIRISSREREQEMIFCERITLFGGARRYCSWAFGSHLKHDMDQNGGTSKTIRGLRFQAIRRNRRSN